MRSRLAALALALATAGCTKIVDTKDLEPLASAQGFCEATYSLFISMVSTCYGASPAWGDYYWSQVLPYCNVVNRSSGSGWLGYDRAKAEACISMVRTAGCNTSFDSFPVCNEALVPKAQVGDSCNSYQDCDRDTTDGCFFIGSNTCPGKCLAPRQVGDDCTTYGPSCAYGTYCDYSSTGKCVLGPAEGAACAAGYCGNGYYCSSNTCLRYGRAGASCPGGWECDNNFYCDTTRAPQTCQPYPEDPVRRNVGDSCVYPYACGPGLYCDASNLCQTQSTAAGQHCTNYAECKLPNLCLYNQNLGDTFCIVPVQAGQPCVTGQGQCAYGLACRSTSGIDAAGEIGTCVGLSRTGGDCGSIGEYIGCLESWCDTSGTKKCMAYLPDGAACTSNEQCAASSYTAECRNISAGVNQCKRTCG